MAAAPGLNYRALWRFAKRARRTRPASLGQGYFGKRSFISGMTQRGGWLDATR
jgi:hypothetical protein